MLAGTHAQTGKELFRPGIERRHQYLRARQQGRQQHIIGCDITQERGGCDRRFKHRLGCRHRAELTTHRHQGGARCGETAAIFRHHETGPAEFRHLLPAAAIEGRRLATQRAQSRAWQGARAEISGTVGHQADQVVIGVSGRIGRGCLIHVGKLQEVNDGSDSARRRQNTNRDTMPATALAANTGRMPMR